MKATYTTGATYTGCALLLLMPVFAAYRGWLLMLLWNWFAPAPFTHIGMAQAYGLSLLVGVMAGTKSASETREGSYDAMDVLGRFLGPAVIAPGFLTLIAWAVHSFCGGS